MDAAVLSRRYDYLAANYDRLWSGYNRRVNRELIRTVSLPQLRRTNRVLDIGCGTGGFLAHVLSRYPQVAEVVALDSSREMLRLAQRKLRQQIQSERLSTRFQCVQGSAITLPFESNCFDLVVSLNVLHYIDPASQLLREARRVLRPGGILLLQDYTRNGWPLFEVVMRLADRGVQHIFSARELAREAELCGLRIHAARAFRISGFWRGVLLKATKPAANDLC